MAVRRWATLSAGTESLEWVVNGGETRASSAVREVRKSQTEPDMWCVGAARTHAFCSAHSSRDFVKRRGSAFKMAIARLYRLPIVFTLLLIPVLAGCSSWRVARNSVRAPCVRPNLLDAPRSSNEPIDYTRLRQDPPMEHRLAARDILGIYIEGILGKAGEAPPVHYSDVTGAKGIPPAIGRSIVVREDNTVALPYIPPIPVAGLTLTELENVIRKAYTTDQQILQPGQDRIIVTLMRPRTYHVMVIREDSGAAAQAGLMTGVVGTESPRHGAGFALELPAYQNDVLHALTETGGLPGVDARSEVKILRNALNDPEPNPQSGLSTGNVIAADRDIFTLYAQTESDQRAPVNNVQVDHEQPTQSAESATLLRSLDEGANVTTIPLQIGPFDPPIELSSEDVILNDGDIVVVQTRESEVFYTGGMIAGDQHLLPRDYDLDVLGAIAVAGGSIAAAAGGSRDTSGVNRGGASIFPPTRVTIIRSINGKQQTIRVNLKRAIVDARERVLIQPNDFILLEYTNTVMTINLILNQVGIGLGGTLWK